MTEENMSVYQSINNAAAAVPVRGVVRSSDVKGTLYQKQLLMDVIAAAEPMSVLNDSRVVYGMSMPYLNGTIPLMGRVAVAKQLDEFESSPIMNTEFTSKDFQLKKDRVKLAVSDEARMSSTVGTPLELQKRQQAAAFATRLEEEILTAIETGAQTLPSVDFTTKGPSRAITEMINTLLPYESTACVMSPAVFAEYESTIGHQLFVGAQRSDADRARAYVPGYNIPIFVCQTLKTPDMYMVSNRVPAVVVGTGGIVSHEEYNMDIGATIYQYDIFRSAFGKILTNDAGNNLGVVGRSVTIPTFDDPKPSKN